LCWLQLSPWAGHLGVNLGDLIGVVGGGFVVSAIAGPINDFINTITLNRGRRWRDTPRSFHRFHRIGHPYRRGPGCRAPGRLHQRNEGRAQIEATFQNRLRVKILVPIDSENPIQRFRRVQGVGVSAIIDLRL
jgi:hypothetical protein